MKSITVKISWDDERFSLNESDILYVLNDFYDGDSPLAFSVIELSGLIPLTPYISGNPNTTATAELPTTTTTEYKKVH